MITLSSFIEEAPVVDKEAFCQRYHHPFLISKSKQTEGEADSSEVDDTEDLGDLMSHLKFETDKFRLEDILAFQSQVEEVWVIPLTKGDQSEKQMITVGRTANNDIHLPFKGISKFHAYFLVEGMEAIIVDGDSTNGTYVNSKRLPKNAKRVLNSLDVITFSNFLPYFFFTPGRLYDYLKVKKML